MDKIESLYKITSGIHIIQVKSPVIGWISNELMDKGDIGIGFEFEGSFRVIKNEERSFLADSIRDPSSAEFVQEVEYHKPTVYKDDCCICESAAEKGDELYSISEFEGILESWVHKEHEQELLEILEKDISDYSPEIAAENL